MRKRVNDIIKWFVCGALILVAAVVCRKSAFTGSKADLIADALNNWQASDSADRIHSNVALNNAVIIFTFDDGNESDYSVAYPILQKYGINGTSFINPHYPDHYIQNKLSWNEIKQMQESGWEFQDHTCSHIALGQASAAQIRRSMEIVNYSFERNSLAVPDTIAYPYGNMSQTAIDAIRPYRKQARLAAVADAAVDIRNIDPYQIQCVSADMQSVNQLKELELVVNWAQKAKVVLVFRTHCLYRDSLNDTGKQPVQTSSKLFARLVEYCVQRGCEFTTMAGLLRLYTGEAGGSTASSQTVSTAAQSGTSALQNPEPESPAGQYVFFIAENGLYRANLDGSEKTLLESGKYLRLIGSIGEWVFFTDKDDQLYRVDENGQQKTLLSDGPVSDALIMNNTLYCIQSGNLCSLDADGAVKQRMELPEDILQLPYHLISDGGSLYICTCFEQGFCSIYSCDLQNGRLQSALENVCDDPFVLYERSAIQVNQQSNEIDRQHIDTGVNEKITDFTGTLYDMDILKDWLIYITRPDNDSQLYINGYNMSTGGRFQLASGGDHIFQVLPAQILIMNSGDHTISQLTIRDNHGYLDVFG